MSPTELKKVSRESVDEFVARVPNAVVDKRPVVKITGHKGRLRVKRASSLANQIHVGRGEPIIVHVPGNDADEGASVPDKWYVLPVRWQLGYARTHAKTAAQHASHAFDCMAIKATDLEAVGATLQAIDDKDLLTKCTQALEEAQDPVLKIMIRAINRARDAVANVLIDTLQEGLLADDA